jgi:hypothetical protein
MAIQLTEGDTNLLMFLGQCGVMRKEQARNIYGSNTKLYIKRIEKLSAAGMIIREGGYIRPTARGLNQAGIDMTPLRIERKPRLKKKSLDEKSKRPKKKLPMNYCYGEHALAVEIASQLPGWEPVYGRQLKRTTTSKLLIQIMRSSRMSMTISKGKQTYAVYAIVNNPKSITLKQIISDMNSYTKLRHVIIFCPNDAIMQTFVQAIGDRPPQDLTECLLLPYPEGIKYFKRANSPELYASLEKAFPDLQPSTRPGVDYEVGRTFISVLTTNDLVKIYAGPLGYGCLYRHPGRMI